MSRQTKRRPLSTDPETAKPVGEGKEADTSGPERVAKSQKRLFFDAYALTASTILSAVAGFASYLLSARLFSDKEVGQAAGWTAAMLLLSGMSQLDLPNTMHRFLPSAGATVRRLLAGSYLAVLVTSIAMASMFVAVLGDRLLGDTSWTPYFWFVLTVAAWSLFNLQDHVLMSLGASLLVPIENTIFGALRLTLLFLLPLSAGAAAIYASWFIPVAILLAVVTVALLARVIPSFLRRSSENHIEAEHWTFGEVARFAAGGYLGTLSGLLTTNVLPLVVLHQLGEQSNAHFYMAWMIISNIDLVLGNFGISLVVQGAAHPHAIRQMFLATLRKQLIIVGPAVLVLFALPDLVLGMFGKHYTGAADMLRFMALGVLCRTLVSLFVPLLRLAKNIKAVAMTQVFSSMLVLGLTVLGLHFGGLTGIGLGYFVAQLVLVVVLVPMLWHQLRQPGPPQSIAPANNKPSSGNPVRRLLDSLYLDFKIAMRWVFVTRIAGSRLTPRVARFAIYRSYGMQLKTPNVFAGAKFTANRVSIGKNTFVNTDCTFEDVAPIIIGNNCQIAMQVLFVTTDHPIVDGVMSHLPRARPIVIGDNVWIGARSTILPGVTIGRGCVIAAGAVVTRDCAPYGLYAGIPARRVKELRPPNARRRALSPPDRETLPSEERHRASPSPVQPPWPLPSTEPRTGRK